MYLVFENAEEWWLFHARIYSMYMLKSNQVPMGVPSPFRKILDPPLQFHCYFTCHDLYEIHQKETIQVEVSITRTHEYGVELQYHIRWDCMGIP